MRYLLTWIVLLTANSAHGESYHLWDHLVQGSRDILAAENLPVVVGGGVGTGASLAWGDHEAQDYFQYHHRLGRLEDLGNNVLGTGAVGAAIGLGTLFYGVKWADEKSLNAGEAHLEALFMSLVYTSIFKISVQRERPDGSNRASFPSGHTSTMACTSAVMMSFYGPWVGAPFIALTAITGASRIADGKHHLSDVVAGATLGYLVGQSYSRHHLGRLAPRVAVLPFMGDDDATGISLRYLF